MQMVAIHRAFIDFDCKTECKFFEDFIYYRILMKKNRFMAFCSENNMQWFFRIKLLLFIFIEMRTIKMKIKMSSGTTLKARKPLAPRHFIAKTYPHVPCNKKQHH